MPKNNLENAVVNLYPLKKEESKLNSNSNVENDKSSVISIVCRICYDGDKDEPLITPCHCRGTVAFVHRTCLEKWLVESNTTSCEICHHVYQTERMPKYTARQSIWRWFRYQPVNVGFHVRGLRRDILACTILTPLAIVITYVCLFSADYYNQKKFGNIPAAKWTSVSLLVMISIMLMGYYLWVYMVIRYHGRVWYYCWQRECVVRYVPPDTHADYNVSEENRQPRPQEIELNVETSDSIVYSETNYEVTHFSDNNVTGRSQIDVLINRGTTSVENRDGERAPTPTANHLPRNTSNCDPSENETDPNASMV